MPTRRVPALNLLILLATACSGVAGGPGSQALDPATEPIPVAIRPDPSRAVSDLMPVEGGTLTATGPDGTRFTLEIPSGALVEATTITMTPLSSIDGIPFGEAPTAVQLEPSSLTFYDFVTLTVEPPVDIPIDQQIPIAASGADNSLQMPFAEIADGVLHLKLLHFSSAGATKGFLADTEPWRERLGGDVEARLSSVLARELLRYRQQQLAGNDEPIPDSLWEWASKTWWEQVMKPRFDAAGESCAAGRLAVQTALSFVRQAQLMGWDTEDHNLSQQVWGRLSNLLPTVARQCLQEEYELCRDEHILHRILPVVVGLERQNQLAGPSPEMDQIIAEGMDLARRCLRFELAFESSTTVIHTAAGGTIEYTSAVEARVPIELQGSNDEFLLGGSSALENNEFTFTSSDEHNCSTEDFRGGATFNAATLSWQAMPPDDSHPYGYVQDVLLTYSPGFTTEAIVMNCRGGASQRISLSYWTIGYLATHVNELTKGEASVGAPALPDIGSLFGMGQGWPGVAIPGGAPVAGRLGEDGGPPFDASSWEVRGGELFATKEWDLSTPYGDASISEEGLFELYHRPQ